MQAVFRGTWCPACPSEEEKTMKKGKWGWHHGSEDFEFSAKQSLQTFFCGKWKPTEKTLC